ncbi:MAG: TauD/TfdA family dioxygenase [Myxococcales bacterium]|nr:TauD/TfdA family dioxygenase [Myxococcales bacterium]
MKLEIHPLPEALGARVAGYEPSQSLDVEAKGLLLRALRRHMVLIFRGHSAPSEEEFVCFGRSFGELAPGAEIFGDVSNHPEIIPITNQHNERGEPLGTASSVKLNWHHDYSYLPRTAKETFLQALLIPEAPCDTHFCDSYTALESLPTDLANRLRELEAHHDIDGSVPEEDQEFLEAELAKKRQRHRREGRGQRGHWRHVHPMVRRHPESGREVLYISQGMTSRVEGLPESESRDLLEALFEHQLREEFIYSHRWQAGDMVLFDSFGVLHARDRFDPKERRYLRQMSTVVGEEA